MSDTQAKDPLAWLKDEWAALARRRFDGPDGAAARPIVGLALSGGGIRSASVSVGVLQALDRAGVLDRVDYLSTVSGGGYAGIGWLSRLAQEAPAASAAAARPAGRFPYAQGQAGLIWLRDRASYLLPPGAWEVVKVAAMVVRKLAGNVFRMLSAMMVMATLLALLSLGVTLLPPWASDPGTLARYAALLLVVVVLVVGVLSCLIDTARAAKPPTPGLWQRLKTRLGGLFRRGQGAAAPAATPAAGAMMDTVVAGILVALVVLLLAAIQPWLVSLAVRLLKPQTGAGLADVSWGDLVNAVVATISAITGAVGVLGLGSRLRGSRAVLTTTLLAAAVAALLYALVLAAAALMVLGTAANGGAWQAAAIMGFCSAAVAAFVLGGYISPNATSLHGFYRRRLADAFIGTAPPPRLSGLMPALTGGPFPIVNATVNGVVDGGEERRGRTTCGFTMTPLRVGNGSLDYCETTTAEKDDPRFDAASAMALSGAAMGGNQSGTGLGARLLRGVFNLRTARWMTNPARLRHGVPPAWSYWKPRWLLLEWFGIRRISRDSRYILVSDGGHHENLGINALIHRGCDIIIVVDAEADKEMTFNGLAVATRLARLDAEGTEIDIVPAALGHEKEKGCVRAHFCQGDIRYGGTIAARSAGGSARLIYVKASVSGDEPLDILEYRTRNPDFPHETTADQFFSEEQFESYRSLGEHIGMNVLAQSALLQRLAASYSSPSSA